MASPSRRSASAGETCPPGLSMIRRVTPCRMNIVASVTTIGCMRRTATKKPLKAPDGHPDPDACGDDHQRRQRGILKRGGERDVDKRDRRARREIESARQDDDGLPDRRKRERRAARCELGKVVVGQSGGTDARHRREQHEEDCDGDQKPPLPRETLERRRRGDGFARTGRCGRHRHAALREAASPPSAARRISSSESCSAGISQTIRPA